MKKSKLNKILSVSWMNLTNDCNSPKWKLSLTDSHACDVFKTHFKWEYLDKKKAKNHYLSQDFLFLHTNRIAHIKRFFIRKHSAFTDRIVIVGGISKISVSQESRYHAACKRSNLLNKWQINSFRRHHLYSFLIYKLLLPCPFRT